MVSSGLFAPAFAPRWRQSGSEGPAAPARPRLRCKSGLCYTAGAKSPFEAYIMSVDAATVRRIAHLARIAVTEAEVPHLQGELNAMLDFVEQLSEVNVDGVEPMTSVTPMEMKKRSDVVNDGEIADEIVQNAPDTVDHFFLVPKVVE
jgi:aspartyl-tRNA(Asn)/glutamyl-tRNA(Gln) amidotransferase subunit C